MRKTKPEVLALRAWIGSAGLNFTSLDGRFDLKLTQKANPTIFVRGIQYEYTGLGFPNCDGLMLVLI